MSGDLALSVADLRIRLSSGDSIVEDVDLQVRAGEILGLVGESGSGKTTTALAVLGYAEPGVEIASGEVRISGQPLPGNGALRAVRGSMVSYVPQNPGTALNPSLRIADSIVDMITAHRGRVATGDTGVASSLAAVGLPESRAFGGRFPHELSGGQQQRVCIAVSLVCEPGVVVLDEPTTGLDVVTQARILEELLRLRDERHVAMIYVTHDLAVVAQIADRIAVMYAGQIVEQGRSKELLRRPRHPYTRGLMASIPDHVRPSVLEPMVGVSIGVGERPTGCSFAPRCSQRIDRCDAQTPSLGYIGDDHRVRCFEWSRTPPLRAVPLELVQRESGTSNVVLQVEGLRLEHHGRRETVVAADDVSFILERDECLALVGESGSGKTTIARAIAGLHPIAAGTIRLDGQPLPVSARARSTEQRRRIQLVFQNPADALNPRHTVRSVIGRPAQILRGLGRDELDAEIARLLDSVRLPSRLADRYPGELSGGERQRVAIARALAAEPEVIVCDEITSALDVSVQAAVLRLLGKLRADLGITLVFITHDLGVVASVADRVLVLEGGLVREQGLTARVLGEPTHPYTQRLLAAAPSISVAIDRWDSEAADDHSGEDAAVGQQESPTRHA